MFLLNDDWGVSYHVHMFIAWYTNVLYSPFHISKMVKKLHLSLKRYSLFSLDLQCPKVLCKLPTPNADPLQIPETYWISWTKHGLLDTDEGSRVN